MNITLDVIIAGITIATFTAAVMRVTVIRPISDKLTQINDSIVSLRNKLEEIDRRSNDLRVRIAAIETSIKSLQHQINDLKEGK
ncbi:hypothetical protein [Synergistes jonesii]|uniref:Uncharacterized protein n=1 Tax=Synergistes jonesii TaxID=2754 RepID=A0A073INJ8_9BACT|nr:hypothetical protein [Synergistes jonesii]KEJ91145.1 hypothetical protein EH55_13295 [Synergistes jonesii]OFB60253.1 hypothetical protein JS73_13105 [Synergistes jonesii]OFB60939.1 hypothetical protein JS79_12745 [Synergistes jonesii]OFB64622.1 hypothetical protein JS72_04045 [Synergistes jonesii]OFB66460.1 hypothetical protein JS78_13125 [Synergistes jonesii]